MKQYKKQENVKPTTDKVYYLASPYSSAIPKGRKKTDVCLERHHRIQKYGADLMKMGYICWEPIAISHYKAVTFNMPQNYQFWKVRDRKMIKNSDGVIVVEMHGWDKSVGVSDEVDYAISLGKPVYLYNPHKKTFSIHSEATISMPTYVIGYGGGGGGGASGMSCKIAGAVVRTDLPWYQRLIGRYW